MNKSEAIIEQPITKEITGIFQKMTMDAGELTKADVEKFLIEDVIFKAVGERLWNDYKDDDEEESEELTRMKYLVALHNLEPSERKKFIDFVKVSPDYYAVGLHDLQNLITLYVSLMQEPPAPKSKNF